MQLAWGLHWNFSFFNLSVCKAYSSLFRIPLWFRKHSLVCLLLQRCWGIDLSLSTLLVTFQGPTKFVWDSEEGAGSDSSPHLLRWSVKYPVTPFLSGYPTPRDSWSESSGQIFLGLSFLIKEKRTLLFLLLFSPLLTVSVFFFLKPSFWCEAGRLSDLLTTLDAVLGHLGGGGGASCPSVHGFPSKKWLSWVYHKLFCLIGTILRSWSLNLTF